MLVWQDNTAVNYSNWGPPGLGPSMLSHNSCYWIQSSSGLWRPGACTNITMGVVCKLPRGEPGSQKACAQPAMPTAGPWCAGAEALGGKASGSLVCSEDGPWDLISKADSKRQGPASSIILCWLRTRDVVHILDESLISSAF